jgi:hypothetical protein
MRALLEYRLYCLAGDGHFSKVEEILAKDDEAAVGQARAMNKSVRRELWQRSRKVTVLQPAPERAAP